MPDIWTVDKLVLFLAFFVPGFISMQIYGMIVPCGDRDFTKQLPDAVAYSAIHWAFFIWPLLFFHGIWFMVTGYLVVLFVPIFEAPAVLLLRNWKYYWPRLWTKYVFQNLLLPEAEPWDRLFAVNDERWIRIRMKDGSLVGGVLGVGSLTSTYPSAHEVYVSEEWTFTPDGKFHSKMPRTKGFIVGGDQIALVELFE